MIQNLVLTVKLNQDSYVNDCAQMPALTVGRRQGQLLCAYKGIDIWNVESYKERPQTNSFGNELDNFAIRIRLTNFKPVETFKDRDDYGNLGSLIGVPPPENRWIHVGVKALDKHGTFQDTVSPWRKDEKGWGPFA